MSKFIILFLLFIPTIIHAQDDIPLTAQTLAFEHNDGEIVLTIDLPQDWFVVMDDVDSERYISNQEQNARELSPMGPLMLTDDYYINLNVLPVTAMGGEVDASATDLFFRFAVSEANTPQPIDIGEGRDVAIVEGVRLSNGDGVALLEKRGDVLIYMMALSERETGDKARALALRILDSAEIGDAPTSSDSDYAAAWTAGGDVYVLLPGDAAPRVVAEGRASIPRLSPDAAFVAFQRGDSLFVVGTDGTNERTIFDAENAPADIKNEGNLVSAGRRSWLDGDTLLFNTFQYNDFHGFPNDDLHIADMETGESKRAEIGGEFAPSPDGTLIAVAIAGYYGEFPGTIHIIDADGTNPREVMQYTAVATATEGQFAPQLQWVDANTFRVAIPNPDLVYMDNAQPLPSTPLWEVDATTNEAVQIGDGFATFFGLPVWNDSGSRLASLTWSSSEENRIALTIANGDGSDSQQVAFAEFGGINPQGWVPGNEGERFVYLQDDILHLSGLSPADAPLLLDETAVRPQVAVHATGVVYAVELADGSNEVRAVGFDGSAPVTLATTGESRPRVNAVSLSE